MTRRNSSDETYGSLKLPSITDSMLEIYGGDKITFPTFAESINFFHGLLSSPRLAYRSDHKNPYNLPDEYSWSPRYTLLQPLPGKLADDFNHTVLDKATAKWEDFKDISGINALTMARFGRVDEPAKHEPAKHVVLLGQTPDATPTQKTIVAAFANFIAACLEELGYNNVPVYVITWNMYEGVKGIKLESITTTKTQSLANITKQFTDASGVSTALAKIDTAQGTRSFWLLKKGDTKASNQGENLEYRYKSGTGMSRVEVAWPVDMPGIRKMISYTRESLGILLENADGRIAKMSQAHHEDREEFQEIMQIKAKSERALAELMQVEANTIKQKQELQTRKGGFVMWSPPIDEHPRTGCVIDMAISMSYESTHSTDALENYIILGDKFSEQDIYRGLNCNNANPTAFKYPIGGKLVFKTAVTPISRLMSGTQVNENGERDTPVLKDGVTTSITMGRLSPVWGERPIQMPDGSTKFTKELIIFPVIKKHEPFSGQGDSGSAIVHCINDEAELVGIITGGSGYNKDTDVTWATPAEVLQEEWTSQGYYLPGKSEGKCRGATKLGNHALMFTL
ncbi:hypothetical protein DV736_g243, partial [Chaetothyriales sp. CBS 134916]